MAEDEKEKSEKPEGEEGKEGEGDVVADAAGKKSKKKKLLLIGAGIGILVLAGAGAGLYFSGLLGGEHKQEAATEGHQEADSAPQAHGDASGAEGGVAKEGEPKAQPVFLALGDILVNLSGEGKRPNFLKIKVALELSDEKEKAAVDALKPRIIDNFQVYLRELRVEDLRGSAGLYRLREELLLRVSEIVQPLRVRDVLFQEILVQ